jgi:hypothetical protein
MRKLLKDERRAQEGYCVAYENAEHLTYAKVNESLFSDIERAVYAEHRRKTEHVDGGENDGGFSVGVVVLLHTKPRAQHDAHQTQKIYDLIYPQKSLSPRERAVIFGFFFHQITPIGNVE